jgi:hypothetical protein
MSEWFRINVNRFYIHNTLPYPLRYPAELGIWVHESTIVVWLSGEDGSNVVEADKRRRFTRQPLLWNGDSKPGNVLPVTERIRDAVRDTTWWKDGVKLTCLRSKGGTPCQVRCGDVGRAVSEASAVIGSVSHQDDGESRLAYFTQKILRLLVHFTLVNYKLIFDDLVPHILVVVWTPGSLTVTRPIVISTECGR